jgi:hypothetical protein
MGDPPAGLFAAVEGYAGAVPPMTRRRAFSRPFLAAGALLLLLPSSSCSTHPGSVAGQAARAGAVVVRATFRDSPLAGARVEFRLPPEGPGKTPVAVGTTDREGIAAFDLPPGRYLLSARWTKDGDGSRPVAPGDRYAWFGGNPVFKAQEDSKVIFLSMEEFPEPPATVGEPAGGTGVGGRVLADGAPVDGASVFAYVRTETSFHDPGFAVSAPTGADGSFVIELPPGDYYLLVRKRSGGGVAGPMRKGDMFGYYPGNPVAVRAGGYRLLSIPAIALKLRNVPTYSGMYKGAALIEGRIVAHDGTPRAGAYAALYENPDLLNRPAYLSEETGADGRFRLPVPVPGTFFLGARSGYGGAPGRGDVYGRFEGNAEHSVTVGRGDHLEGVVITVHEVR